MKTIKMNKVVAATIAALALGSGSAYAASGTSTLTPATVANQVNFSIVIPAFLTFRVGTAGAVINTMLFTVPAANVGNATAVAATGGDAPAGGTGVNVSVVGNRGQVTITTAVAAATGLGTGTPADGFINYNQISTVSTNAANLNAPVLANAAIPAVLVTLGSGAAGRVTNQAAIWNYSYLNTTVPSSGTYSGSATYTATMP
jgi:hypothetical protein